MKSIDDIIKAVTPNQATVIDVAGDGPARKLTVEMRKLLPEAPRIPILAPSPARAHIFLSAASLADYLARYGCAETVVYADPENERISAVLNERAPSGGHELVTMAPQLHPLWAPWAKLAGRRISLEDFARFVAENRRSIIEPAGRELSMTLSQVRAVVSVEIDRGRGKDAVNGLVVRSKIQGTEKSERVELPDSLALHVPLYVQTDAKRVDLDLCIEADRDGTVSVLVTSGTVAEARVAAFGEMIETVRGGTEALGCVHTFGRPQHRPWDVLEEDSA